MNLKDILRKGDPAAGEPGLSADEIRAMRRTVLSAVPEPRRRGWLLPVLAAAAVLAIAAALVLSLWRSPEPAAPKIAAPAVPNLPAPPTLPPAVAASPVSETPVHVTEKQERSKRVGRRRPLHRNGGEGRGEGARDQIALAQTESHQIQFSTPGGTRIIWVLNPAGE
jgi:hypothetical protein